MAALAAPSALAVTPRPGFEVLGMSSPTNLPPGGEGKLELRIYDVGAAPVEGTTTVTDTLPPGLTSADPECPESTPGVVTCSLPEGYIYPPEATRPSSFEIKVHVAAGASNDPQPVNRVRVSGGGALHAASVSFPVHYSSEPAGAGFAGFDAWMTNADGTTDTQAGSHPYELTIVNAFNTEVVEGRFNHDAGGEPRNLVVNLPPGLVGDPDAVARCSRIAVETEESEACPRDSLIGVVDIDIEGDGFTLPLFNVVPPPGVAAQFIVNLEARPGVLDSSVRSGGDNGITVHVGNIPQERISLTSTTIWGVPGEHGTGAGDTPLLTLPTSCQGPQKFGIELEGTWQNAAARASATTETHDEEHNPVGFTGCEKLVQFAPKLTISPDTSQADSPAGLTASLRVPQGVNPEGLATSGLKNTTVVLPEGMAINPGQATGLAACQPSQENIGGPEAEKESEDGPPTCPAASKVGEDEISTPLLPDRLKGNVYVLQSNPPELKLLVAASADGVNLKLVGTVHLNEATGQLTTTFENTPDAPLDEFKLSFSGGPQAALVTPPTCRVYKTNADFTPWASPLVSDALVEDGEDSFTIDGGPGGSPCANPLPFAPTLTAGSTTDQAGGYTGFSMLLQRGDGQQRVSKLQFTTPKGLLGMIAQIPLCPEPQAGKGECSSASEIGHTIVGAGPGPYPLYIPEAGQPPAPIYLTGGYEGAPYGLSIVVPIVAGPFTLQTQIVRAKIEVDPHTAQLTITTDPLPTIIDGIPADLRSINAVIDRPGFVFNPTDCDPTSFSGTATSAEGATAAISSPFQVASCQALTFKPDFTASTAAQSSKADGASLDAKIVYPTTPLGSNQASAQANIASVKVDLPKQLPSELKTLQKACTAAQFETNPAGCPAASVVGHATAVTPVLPVALTGPAYFVSHGGEAFPSLIVVLQGYGVTIDLVGTTFINGKTDITSSTFKQVPDVPIDSFELSLPQGPYSALGANLPRSAHGSFCGQKLAMPTVFTAQNGTVIRQSTPIAVDGCAKAKTLTRAQQLAKLLKAQQLANALKACRKKAKGRRGGCEKQARKRYGQAGKAKSQG
jgi:hypothetical protein